MPGQRGTSNDAIETVTMMHYRRIVLNPITEKKGIYQKNLTSAKDYGEGQRRASAPSFNI